MDDFDRVKRIIEAELRNLKDEQIDCETKIRCVREDLKDIHKVLFGCYPGKLTEEARPKKGVVDGM